MQLTPAGTSQYESDDERPLIHFDRHLGAGWSSVYGSSKSHIIIKFSIVPQQNKAKLERQLRHEKAAYDKLRHLGGWVVPHLYGEYEWYGGRALVMSDCGSSLAGLNDFASLHLLQRCESPKLDEICANSYATESSCFVGYT